jgi:hypothetical protein
MLVVNPWDWLRPDGTLPLENPRLYRRILRVAQIIEYGGSLAPHHARETLLPCSKRPKGKACPGLMWVVKTPDETILAYCIACGAKEAMVHNWQETEWAKGPMQAVNLISEVPKDLN